MFRSTIILAIATSIICSHHSFGDDLLYHYEADVLPYDPTAGWVVARDCLPFCNEIVSNGRFVLSWGLTSEIARYNLIIAQSPIHPPDTLWVEWSYRSNHPIGQFFDYCDGSFSVKYRNIYDYVYAFGNYAQSSGGNAWVSNLSFDDFHTFRFESLNGVNYALSVDGFVFLRDVDTSGSGYNAIQFGGEGRCPGDAIQEVTNEWDFIRYGTIASGEQIVSSNPPAGFVDARLHPALDRFTIKYDSPNYVYLNEITVEVIPNQTAVGRAVPTNQYRDHEGAVLKSDQRQYRNTPIDNPVVVATRRLDNGPPDVVEIVLDRPIPYNAATRFTFDDGTLSQSLEFTYAPGDTDGDGQASLSDLAAFQNCFGSAPLTGLCPVLDSDNDSEIDLSDFASFPW